jgi:hypothetical protein
MILKVPISSYQLVSRDPKGKNGLTISATGLVTALVPSKVVKGPYNPHVRVFDIIAVLFLNGQ